MGNKISNWKCLGAGGRKIEAVEGAAGCFIAKYNFKVKKKEKKIMFVAYCSKDKENFIYKKYKI